MNRSIPMFPRIAAITLEWALLAFAVAVGGPAQEVPLKGEATKESRQSKDDYYELYKMLVDTMDQVERNYVKEIDRRELVEAAIQGVLSKLDEHSSYIGPKDIERFRSDVESEFGGIGIQIGVVAGQLKVISPLVGTPAYRAGVLAGDRIVEIDGEETSGISMEEAVRRLKGPSGSEVELAVVHAGSSQRVKLTIQRKVVQVETVVGDHRQDNDAWDFMIDTERRIGYVRVTAFSRDTPDELRRVLRSLSDAKMRGLVLDLRFNPGGLLRSAIEVSDLFLAEGRIVSTKGRNSPERTWDARKPGTFEGFPMAVLVNRYSASAAEIVAACLQDHKRAVIVGERTWGKGSVQNVIELEDGHSVLKLTTAGYLRPSGKNLDRHASDGEDEWGVHPSEGFALRLSTTEMIALVHDQRRRDVARAKPLPPVEDEGDNDDDADETDKTDRINRINRIDEINEADEAGKTDADTGGADQPNTDQTPPQPGDGQPPKAQTPGEDDDPADEPPSPQAFVDRQLAKALEYLAEQIASADERADSGD